jgi:hypothetical protein
LANPLGTAYVGQLSIVSSDTAIVRPVPEIVTETRESSAARVPSVPVGTALVITRYDEEKAVVLNPQDFHRLSALDHDLEELTSRRPELSELALKAHALEDQPGTPVEDPDEIKALLGL